MCKKHLPLSATTCYGNSAPAKSGVGFRSLQMLSATNDAPASFLLSALAHIQIMAGRMGESKDSPVSDNAGTANPVRSATPKFRSFGGGIRYPLSEAAAMATVPGQSHPKFQYRFMALDRADRQAKPCKIIIEATSEHEARKALASHYILSLSAVLPAQEVRHD
ncbi:host cell division inhibitor Icd-like protein [Salmonella enterica]|nr:host cell division inhibitor Icd-like protein [Salmonella enterica]EBL0007089.1 host cell division inhibitor Icd-like protein [Salmonella enterica]